MRIRQTIKPHTPSNQNALSHLKLCSKVRGLDVALLAAESHEGITVLQQELFDICAVPFETESQNQVNARWFDARDEMLSSGVLQDKTCAVGKAAAASHQQQRKTEAAATATAKTTTPTATTTTAPPSQVCNNSVPRYWPTRGSQRPVSCPRYHPCRGWSSGTATPFRSTHRSLKTPPACWKPSKIGSAS